MAREKNISEAIVKRLPRYYRYLTDLEDNGETKVSSSALADLLNITASQVRQDFFTCNLGGFGMQGYGYEVKRLRREILSLLGLDRVYNVIIIGAGNIGTALSSYNGFIKEGFIIKAVFDIRTEGKKVPQDVELLHMDMLTDYVRENNVDIAIIATQKDIAYDTALRLKGLGIRSIWNFAPTDLVIDGMAIENINMSESLFVLTYRMKNK